MRLIPILLLTLLGVISCSSPKDDQVSFNQDIRPILNKNCLACHGGVKKLGGFSLLFEHEAFEVNDSGLAAIVPGNADSSEMVKRLFHPDPEIRMPYQADPLSDKEITLIKKWINQGAKWEKHWAYVPPRTDLKIPQGNDWTTNEIDQFILSKIRDSGLEPEQEASCHTLVRRLAFDLTGLPPSREDVELYCNSPDTTTYNKLVSKYLDSKHFGERWASMWLDLARYADTKGYEADRHRNIWKYRDWVIDAFNSNQPFDQFTIEQIAGDLLPESTEDQILATAFHRNTMNNDEGGTDDEEFRVAAVIDRVNTTWETWMGTTFACVQCHSHPYDPFTQTEYYEFFAFLNNTADSDKPDESPTLEVYRKEDEQEAKRIKEWIRLASNDKSHQKDSARSVLMSYEKTPIPVMQELQGENRRETFIFEGGNFLSKSDRVEEGIPHEIKYGKSNPTNRLEMAQWLVSSDNPLTSRVIANRIWEQFFGKGLVETLEDFGTQGAKPTHPELLDWLALEFQYQYDWDLKALMRLMVSSSTYKQSSRISKEKLEKDPYNHLYARASRIRLSGEMVRDQSLQISGLLSPKMYGPSVMPPQPAGVWASVYNNMKWETSEGEDRYRRALYTYWRRTSPYPSMISFDAPSREFCVSRRIDTNTPLQALVTMNDPVYVEAAQAFAKEMEKVSRGNPVEGIAWGFERALFREPTGEEVQELLTLYQMAYHEGSEMPMAIVANTLFNLDEFLNRN